MHHLIDLMISHLKRLRQVAKETPVNRNQLDSHRPPAADPITAAFSVLESIYADIWTEIYNRVMDKEETDEVSDQA